MTRDYLSEFGVVDIAQLVKTGAADPTELVELALQRIAKLDSMIGAVVALDPDRARADAAAVSRDLPLAGVPILIKDTNLDVRGFATRHGSRFYQDANICAEDSEFVRRLRAAGMIVLGKSKTPEFAGDFATEPRAAGPTHNPWDLARTPGGSSGGSAAAVASRMVPAAHGTDCGGSIRVPAACCGVVGLKPTRGRTPAGPAAGERVAGLNAESMITHTVRDIAALLSVLSALEQGAPYQTRPPIADWLQIQSRAARRLTIGVTRIRPDGTPVHPTIVSAVDRIQALLGNLGHRFVPFEWPDIAGAGSAAEVFWQGEIAELIEARKVMLGREPSDDEIEPLSRHAWTATRRRSALDYLAAKSIQNRVTRRMAAAFEPIDVLLLPVTADLPPLIGAFTDYSDTFSYEKWAKAAYGFAPFTEIFNLTGQPALSIPALLSAEHLPIGVQLVAGFGEDELLLSVAQTLEDIIRWPDWRPAVAGE
jgi:amidase